MQKVTDFLEKHVQWVAIALGAAFALWMGYAYWMQSPAQVQVDGTTYTAGEVAKHTQETVGQQLSSKINSTATVPMAVPQPAEKFRLAMAWQGVPETTLAYIWPNLPAEVNKTTPSQSPTPGGGPPTPEGPVARTPVEKLPALPAAHPEVANVGRSTVQIPAIQQQPQPAAGEGATPAPAPAPAQPQGPQTKDIEWVTQSFTIPMAELDAAFKAAKIPPGGPVYTTCFLQIEMIRQEVTFDGKNVGAEQVVKTMEANPQGQIVPTYPGDNSDKQAQATYLAWATQNSAQILQPPFYQVDKGDPWTQPGTTLQQQQQQYTLENPPPNWQSIPEWKEAVMKYRQQQAKERADQKRTTNRGGGGGAGGAGGGPRGIIGGATGSPAPRDTARPAPPPRAPQPAGVPGAAVGAIGTPQPTGVIGGEGAIGGGGGNGPVGTLPTGDFDPSKFTQPLVVWGHDIHVTPGKSYKYKMRYRIRNPLFGVINVAKNPAFAQQFAIVSPDSEWSKIIVVPAKTNFFVARNIGPNADKVAFDVFKWEEGIQHQATFIIAPGDMLGGQNSNVDYTTDWTLVGFQQDPRTQDVQILLVDKEGSLMTRSAKQDQNNDLYKRLKELVRAAQPTAGAGGAPTGLPAVPGGTAALGR
ncbi:MAG TPA: hypothetical protein VF669_05005 [Tepidisphaeraceae bacterium]|jgi:hypothetical protein